MITITKRLLFGLACVVLTIQLAHAQQVTGTIHVYNDDCTEVGCGFLSLGACDRVDVHLRQWESDVGDAVQCTDTPAGPWIQDIGGGSCKSITVNGKYQNGAPDGELPNYDWKTCHYNAEARGVADVTGVASVDGGTTSYIRCSNDWIGVCQCRVSSAGSVDC
jgi:hypothetical protein